MLGNFSGIISGVLAYAFDTVSGSRGLSGWQWYVLHSTYICAGFAGELTQARLFLFEGIVTIVFGILLWFVLPNCESDLIHIRTRCMHVYT